MRLLCLKGIFQIFSIHFFLGDWISSDILSSWLPDHLNILAVILFFIFFGFLCSNTISQNGSRFFWLTKVLLFFRLFQFLQFFPCVFFWGK
jgi:hypothetical protein